MNVRALGESLNGLAQRFWRSHHDWTPESLSRSASPTQVWSADEDAVILSMPPRLRPPATDSSPMTSAFVAGGRACAPSAEMRALALRLSPSYLSLLCDVDAVCVMGMRQAKGLETEAPSRLGSIIHHTVEQLGLREAIEAIHVSTFSSQTMRHRLLIQGTSIRTAEINFILTFAWGASFDVGAERPRAWDATKTNMVARLCGLLPMQTGSLGAQRSQRGIDFVASRLPWSTLSLLMRYNTSAQGMRFAAESRRAEAQIAALFRQRYVQRTIDLACYDAFND